MMSEYLNSILEREALTDAEESNIRYWRGKIESALKANFGYETRIYYAGSYGKKTVNRSKYDLDIIVYLPHNTGISLKDMFYQTANVLHRNGYSTQQKKVALTYHPSSNFHIDIVPGKAVDANFFYANLYNSKQDCALRTSVKDHIDAVKNIRQEVRLLKLWNRQKNLNVKSFILEQIIKRAMESSTASSLEKNLLTFFDYTKKNIENLRLFDPSNSNSNIGDEIGITQRQQLKAESDKAITAKRWSSVIS